MKLTTAKIYEYYRWREENTEKAQKIYSKLFHINDQDHVDVFTTNYDTRLRPVLSINTIW